MESESNLTLPEQNCLNKCRKMEAECRHLWLRAIEFSPRLARYCSHWHDFTPLDWADLVAHNKDFINIAPLHSFGKSEWYIVLKRQPMLIEKCPADDVFPDGYWQSLLQDYPWFEKYRKKQE